MCYTHHTKEIFQVLDFQWESATSILCMVKCKMVGLDSHENSGLYSHSENRKIRLYGRVVSLPVLVLQIIDFCENKNRLK